MTWYNNSCPLWLTRNVRYEVNDYLERNLSQVVFAQMANSVPLFLNDSTRMNEAIDKWYNELLPELRKEFKDHVCTDLFEEAVKDGIRIRMNQYIADCTTQLKSIEGKMESRMQTVEIVSGLSALGMIYLLVKFWREN